MELTVEQALQQGITAHKEGKLQGAERLYKAVLQAQPGHADANHNLGVIAVSVNKAELALPLFKTALEADPKIEQFWLSYIDALIKEKQLETAREVLEQGKRFGLVGEKVDMLEGELQQITQPVLPQLLEKKKNLTLKNKRKKIAESKRQKKQAKGTFANGISDPQPQIDTLLERYQNGEYDEAEKLAFSITQQFPEYQFGWKARGVVLATTGRRAEAVNAFQRAVELSPQDAEALCDLGVTLQALGRLDESEASLRQAIALKTDYAEAHFSLGIALKGLGRLEEAEASYSKSITFKPDFAEAHNNLGNILKELGRLNEAEASLRQAIVLEPDYAEAYNNLGITLNDSGKLKEAEVNYIQAVALKPDLAEVHNNLGYTFKELGRLEEAEVSFRQAIALKPDYAEAYSNLSIILYGNGCIDSALNNIKKANLIDPEAKDYSLLLNVLQTRKERKVAEVSIDHINTSDSSFQFSRKIIRLNRLVKEELINYLYKIKSLDLDKETDPSFGNTRGSKYDLFQDDHFIIKNLAADLKTILMRTFNSNVFLYDSFFSIFCAGGGTNRHNHVNKRDKEPILSLAKQKYSLVYYLSVGDQKCSKPGILKFYEPNEDILPSRGLITIFPADRYHSSVYGGSKDRVIVGVNFYCL